MPATSLVSLLNLIEIVTEYRGEDIEGNLTMIGGFLVNFLSADDAQVKIACAKATAACIVAIKDDTAREAFKPALEPMLTVLGTALSTGDEQEATTIMKHLVTVAQVQPMFFKGSMDGVVAAMVQVAGADGLEFSTRSMALELLVTFTECAPALARRCPALLQGLVPLAMSLMLSLEESEQVSLQAASLLLDSHAKTPQSPLTNPTRFIFIFAGVGF